MTERKAGWLIFGLLAGLTVGFLLIIQMWIFISSNFKHEINAVKGYRELTDFSKNSVEAEGIVVDEAGGPIDGVFLSVNESTGSFDGMSTVRERDTHQYNVRTFHIRSSGYQSVSLHFSKIGYEPVVLGYSKGVYKQLKIRMKRER